MGESARVIVEDGVVHLWGLVGSESERRALTALAHEVPGVSDAAYDDLAELDFEEWHHAAQHGERVMHGVDRAASPADEAKKAR